MYVAIDADKFNINSIFYQERINNNVMENSKFIRIIYSNTLFTLNGIFINFNLKLVTIEKCFNKYKCIFDTNVNNETILSLSNTEKYILQKINIKDKRPVYKISEILHNGFIKSFNNSICNEDKNQFVIKIYGIWENNYEYGLTYKFINI
jgi:hypothetical protein